MSPPSGHLCDPGEGPIALTHARDRGHTGAGAGRHHRTATVRHSVSDHRHHCDHSTSDSSSRTDEMIVWLDCSERVDERDYEYKTENKSRHENEICFV